MNRGEGGVRDIIDVIVAKLTPKVLALLLGLGMLLIALIAGVAVYRGQDVKIFGIEISQPSRVCQDELAACRNALAESIRLTELQEIIGKPVTRSQAADTLRALIRFAGEAAEWRNNFNYRLFELEKQMQRFGGFISTRIQDTSRTAAYRMIQELLSEVGFYDGAITGEQQATRRALVTFQNDYNLRVPEEARITSLGSFGYQTLEAVRSRYRQISGR